MNLFNFLGIFSIVKKLLDFIHNAEAIFKQPGSGTSRLQLVVAQLIPLVQAATDAGLIPEALGTAIVKAAPELVTIIVQIMKLGGGVDPVPLPGVPAGFSYGTVLLAKPDDSVLMNGDQVYTNSSQWFVVSAMQRVTVPDGFQLDHIVTK